MRRFRVAHVITRLCKGGAQENTFHCVRLANRDRFDVDLISGPTEGSEGSIEDAVRAAGIDVIRVPGLVRQIAPMRDLAALRTLTSLFRERRYDIVHTHTSKAGFLGRLAAARAHTPIVVHTPHGHVFHGYFHGFVTRVFIQCERHAARVSDRLIALTERGIEEHLAKGVGTREQWLSIFSGVDFASFEKAIALRGKTRRNLGVEPDDILIGGVGRLEPVKGFAYFVDAARIIAEAMPNARFILAGDGSLASELRAKASGLGGRFAFLGIRTDVPELMAAMDILVVPSINEGMGRVLLESGAAGTPAVASAVGGVPEIVRDGQTGLLVSPRDVRAIADAVMGLAADHERRGAFGRAARAAVVPAYGLERMVERIESLYESLIKEKGLDS